MSLTATAIGYTLFGTAIGSVGIGWNKKAIVTTHLPSASSAETNAAMAQRTADAPRSAPPAFVEQAIHLIRHHVGGEMSTLRSIRVDYGSLTPFQRAICEAARRIPPGETQSYGGVAEMAGRPGAARAVGQVMATNMLPLIVPCHRVTAAGGRAGGFNAAGGLATKARLLAIEGAKLRLPRAKPSPVRGDDDLPFDREAAVAHLSKVDPILRRHIERVGPLGLRRQLLHGTYEMLAESIVYQQLNGKAAATIAGRVKAAFGRDAAESYPPPAVLLAAPEEKLRTAGLSRNKLAAIRDLAEKAMNGAVPPLSELEILPDDEIVDRLTVVRGIGRWTVEMLLMFRLGRQDVLPVDDFGIRKGFGRVFLKGTMPDREAVAARGERWRPFRSAASWYLWRATDGA